MNMVRFIAPVAALVALSACGGEAEDADGKSADAAPPPAQAEPTPSALDAIPMNFRGGWDSVDAGEFACTTLSDTALTIEPKLLQYYEGAFTPETISQISDDRIESEGFFQYADDRSKESYTLRLSDGGKRLTLSGDGFEPFEFRKCATIREAHLIPSEYEGTWSTYGTCKAAADSLIKIAPTKITWQGKTSNFTKVHYAGPNAIELEDDGQEEPYGIVLDQGGKSGALVGPGHSPIPLTRCGG